MYLIHASAGNLKYTKDQFNVTQPILTYLKQIGDVTDEGGKTTELEITPLPVITAGGDGGYQANRISEDNHMFE